MLKINFLPHKITVSVNPGSTLLQAAEQAGLDIGGLCAGQGSCGKCRLKIIDGDYSKPASAEHDHLTAAELKSGLVLACQRIVNSDFTVEVPVKKESSTVKAELAGDPTNYELEPAIEKLYLELAKPSISDQTADLERLFNYLENNNLRISQRDLSALPALLRNNRFKITVVASADKIIAIEPGDTRQDIYGISFDIGTTTIMGSLINLNNNSAESISVTTNTQNIYGADVISRIAYAANKTRGLEKLQHEVIKTCNQIICRLLKESGVNKSQVYEIVCAGNTTMSHLFLGIDPSHLAAAPFIPAYKCPPVLDASSLGLEINPCGCVTFLPNIAGYIGSDTIGVILATDLDRRDGNLMAIDIGTNGELVVAADGRLIACSTAAGPAFEGAQIKSGMRAESGAIDRVDYIQNKLQISTINGAPACGICGSGLIDAVATLLKTGLIEPTGRFISPERDLTQIPKQLRNRLRHSEKGLEFILVPSEQSANGTDVVLTQGDLRELQLAKGAILAGFRILMKEVGIKEENLEQLMLAGAFGNYIRKESAVAIGLIPNLPLERIDSVGNAAGDGARMALVSKNNRERAFELPGKVEHLELSSRSDFQDIFINALNFQPF